MIDLKHIMEAVYSFRPAYLEDQAELFELYRSVMRNHIEQIWGWDDQWQHDDFTEHFDPSLVTVVLCGEKVVGYVQIEPNSSELYLRMLLLTPEHQKKGLGGNVLKQVLSTASEQHLRVKLQVFKSNASAIHFYEHYGFQVIGDTPTSLVMMFNA